jgi:hypothetical protein
MRRFYQIVALCLAALWLPVSMCCAFEAASGEALCPSASCHSEDEGDGATKDGCNVIEDGQYQPTVSTIKIAPPIADLCARVLCSHALKVEAEAQHLSVVAETSRPLDWVPVWQFERRAAALAHAPDSLIV